MTWVMGACETCWSAAYPIARMTGRSQFEVYRELVHTPTCQSGVTAADTDDYPIGEVEG